MLSDICCPQYPLNNFQSICNCDSLLFLKVIVFLNGNEVCLLKCPLKSDLLCFCLFTDFEQECDRVSCLLFLVRDLFQCLELDLDWLFG